MPRLDGLVRAKFNLSWGKARNHIETGKIWVNGQVVQDIGSETDPAAEIQLRMNAPRRPVASVLEGPEPRVIHVDTQVIVLSKPAGMSTVPYKGEEDHSLERWACAHLKQARVRVVQRLDRETSGVMVFARSAEAARHLENQFRFHRVIRRYLALAHGEVSSQTIRSELVENRGDGLRGSRTGTISRDVAKDAVTHVRALATFGGMTLIECRLETGRTHQIRIHLSELGHPLVGEKLYIREFRGERIAAPRMMLHAAELGFLHPTREVPMRWVELPPPEFMDLLPESAKKVVEGWGV